MKDIKYKQKFLLESTNIKIILVNMVRINATWKT